MKATCSPGCWWFHVFSPEEWHDSHGLSEGCGWGSTPSEANFSAVPGLWLRDPGNPTVAVWEPGINGLSARKTWGTPKLDGYVWVSQKLNLGTPKSTVSESCPSNCNCRRRIPSSPNGGWICKKCTQVHGQTWIISAQRMMKIQLFMWSDTPSIRSP